MTRDQAIELINNSKGRIFAVKFVKRSTGELRLMSCRTGVHNYLKGGMAAYDPAEKALISVFDMHKRGYRSIPTEGISQLKVDGCWQAISRE